MLSACVKVLDVFDIGTEESKFHAIKERIINTTFMLKEFENERITTRFTKKTGVADYTLKWHKKSTYTGKFLLMQIEQHSSETTQACLHIYVNGKIVNC